MPKTLKLAAFTGLVHCLSSFALGLALSAQAKADPLLPFWEAMRVEIRPIAHAACKGDRDAMKQVQQGVDAGHPIYLNYTAWLRGRCDLYRSLDHAEVAANQLRAAELGYPPALLGYGNRLIRNLDDGVPHDPARGVEFLDRAVKGGSGQAASALAFYYIEGKRLPRDIAKARKYLAIAEAEGFNPEQTSKHRKSLDVAIAEERAKGNTIPDDPAEAEQFAALAVSTSDGGFGFAHDFPTADAARNRALEECKSRGGRDCSLKMVGRGKGCMAYHSAGGSATAHGWAIGATTNAVETRAARECRQRNDNRTCGNTAWVCNDRTQAPLDVLFEAPMPNLPVATGPAIQCRFYLRVMCKIPGNKVASTFAYESFRNGATFPVTGASDCQSFYEKHSVLISYRTGNYAREWVNPTLQGAAKNRAYGLIDKMKTYVDRKYPGCLRKGIDVEMGIENPKRDNKSRHTSKKSSMNFDNGTPRYHFVTLE